MYSLIYLGINAIKQPVMQQRRSKGCVLASPQQPLKMLEWFRLPENTLLGSFTP